MKNFLEQPSKITGAILSKLKYIFSDKEQFEMFLMELGWYVEAMEDSQLQTIIDTVLFVDRIPEIEEAIDKLINGTNISRIDAIRDLVELSKELIEQIEAIKSINGLPLPSPFDDAAFWKDIAPQIMDYLFIDYIADKHPLIFSFLHFIQVFSFDKKDFYNEEAHRINYTQKSIHWDRLITFFKEKENYLAEQYNWGNSEGYDHNKLFRTLERIFLHLGLTPFVTPPREDYRELFLTGVDVDRGVNELEIPIIRGVSPTEHYFWNIGLTLLPIADPVKSGNPFSGIVVLPTLQGALDVKTYIAKKTYFKVGGAFEEGKSNYFKITPKGIELPDYFGDSELSAYMDVVGKFDDPYILIGNKNKPRIELEGFKMGLGLKGKFDDPELYFVVGSGGVKEKNKRPKWRIVAKGEEANGFLNKILGKNAIEAEFEGALKWSSKTGISFDGSGNLALTYPINKKLGPLEFKNLVTELELKDKIALNLGVGIAANLGAIKLYVDKVGLTTSLVPVDRNSPQYPGVFGGLDVDFDFKPPSGIGIKISPKSKKFEGAGYLSWKDKRYQGILQLNIINKINLTAIGILDTELPDGKKGYSLLIMILADGFKPLELGMGFKLSGIGGLLALNRTMSLKALKEGIKKDTLDKILFPDDPLEDYEAIFKGLDAAFPVAEDRFVFGPMMQLQWGSPKPILQLELGLFIEVPSPVRIGIPGVLKSILPEPDSKKLSIKVNFLGSVDFEKKLIAFDATIFDSRIMSFTLSGDMAFRLKWGEQPFFLLSVGGFHPKAPALPIAIDAMKRMKISLVDKKDAKVNLQTYFAITSNTVQLGAKLDAIFKVAGFRAIARVMFDLLFQFNPFKFLFDASLTIGVFNSKDKELLAISLEMAVSGPAPWHIVGRAKFKIVVELEIDFEVTFGKSVTEAAIPQTDITPLLKAALEDTANWSQINTTQDSDLIKIVVPEAQDNLVLLPNSILRIEQNVVPLEMEIQKFGSARPRGDSLFDFKVKSVGGIDVNNANAPTQNYFARSNFVHLSDAEKLTKPSFELFKSGVQIDLRKLNDTEALFGEAQHISSVDYEAISIDKAAAGIGGRRRVKINVTEYQHLIGGATVGQSSWSQAARPLENRSSTSNSFGTLKRKQSAFQILHRNGRRMNDLKAFAKVKGTRQELDTVLAGTTLRKTQYKMVKERDVVRVKL